MRQEWILLTAGLGSADMQSAARRVARDASRLAIFSQVVVLTNDNLEELCPTISFKYRNILNSRIRGFGYMCWKAEIVYRFLKKNNGKRGVVWIDAGCEVSPSIITRLRLVKNLHEAKRRGYLFFNLDTKESSYTKRELFCEFPSLDFLDSEPQAQTTFFALIGPVGLKIAARWFEIIAKSEFNFNEETKSKQLPQFIEHRHDQSVFSLALKEAGYTANLRPLRNGRGKLFSKVLTFIFDPIIASRNRTGESIAPRLIKLVGIKTLRIFGESPQNKRQKCQ